MAAPLSKRYEISVTEPFTCNRRIFSIPGNNIFRYSPNFLEKYCIPLNGNAYEIILPVAISVNPYRVAVLALKFLNGSITIGSARHALDVMYASKFYELKKIEGTAFNLLSLIVEKTASFGLVLRVWKCAEEVGIVGLKALCFDKVAEGVLPQKGERILYEPLADFIAIAKEWEDLFFEVNGKDKLVLTIAKAGCAELEKVVQLLDPHEIVIKGSQMDCDEVSATLRAIPGQAKFNSIRLECCQFSTKAEIELARIIDSSPLLKELTLVFCNLEHHLQPELLASLRQAKQLRSLNLSMNFLNKNSASSLVNNLPVTLTTLDLSSNELGEEGVSAVRNLTNKFNNLKLIS